MSRKVKISRTPTRNIDPAKIKKPTCPIHTETKMEYNIVRGKWACIVESCNQVATPKSAPEDKAVTFGKGSIQMRLIYTPEGKPHIILLADNNVALDVTDMFDISQIVERFDVKELARRAGVDEFYIPSPSIVDFKSSLYVMGSAHIK